MQHNIIFTAILNYIINIFIKIVRKKPPSIKNIKTCYGLNILLFIYILSEIRDSEILGLVFLNYSKYIFTAYNKLITTLHYSFYIIGKHVKRSQKTIIIY